MTAPALHWLMEVGAGEPGMGPPETRRTKNAIAKRATFENIFQASVGGL